MSGPVVNLKNSCRHDLQGTITVPHPFRRLHWTDQLDLLGDWMTEIELLYDLILHNRTEAEKGREMRASDYE